MTDRPADLTQPTILIRTTICSVSPVGHFRHLRLQAAALTGIAWTPGQEISVDCGSDGHPVLRTYSVWDHRDDWIDLYCVVHGAGPGSTWAQRAEPGQSVRISRPAGGFVTHPAAYHVFAGDAPAAAAFGPMIRGLPDDVPVYAVIETGSDTDRLPFTRDVAWVPRAELGTAVRHLPLPDEPGAAYLAGEARLIQQIRSVLIRDRGWPRRAITTKPFWTPGKRALR